jgi:hypothetical protein
MPERIVVVDGYGVLATRVFPSLADVPATVRVGSLICVDNGAAGEFYVRTSGSSGPVFAPITGGISHVAANGTIVSPDPATINFLNSANVQFDAIPDITDPSKTDVTASVSGLMHEVQFNTNTPIDNVEILNLIGVNGVTITEQSIVPHLAKATIGITGTVVQDVSTHRAAPTALFSASITDNTLDLYAPDPCDCGDGIKPPQQPGANSACNAANALSNWVISTASTALVEAHAQADGPISTGILSVIGAVSEEVATIGWLLNAFSQFWSGSQIEHLQTALAGTDNQLMITRCIYCAIGNHGRVTAGTLSDISNLIQGNLVDIPLNKFMYDFVLALSAVQADFQYQLGALVTAPTFDCSLYDCNSLYNCFSVNPANLQPFYIPQFSLPLIGATYSTVGACWFFDSARYGAGTLVGFRVDLTTVLNGAIPTPAHPYNIFFGASFQVVAQGDTDTAAPLTSTLSPGTDGSYPVTARFVELRGISESAPGAEAGGLELTSICQARASTVAVNITYAKGSGPATATIGDTITCVPGSISGVDSLIDLTLSAQCEVQWVSGPRTLSSGNNCDFAWWYPHDTLSTYYLGTGDTAPVNGHIGETHNAIRVSSFGGGSSPAIALKIVSIIP